MELFTNPLFLASVASLFAIFVSYLYYQKNKKDDEEIESSTYFRIGGLTFCMVLLTTGYMSYVYGSAEQESLAAEFFQTGQPQF